jgi:hypothetical protein
MVLLPNISLELCLALNSRFNMAPEFKVTPPQEFDEFNIYKFVGSPSYTINFNSADNTTTFPPFMGDNMSDHAICFRGSQTYDGASTVNVSTQYFFMYILWPRQA